MTLRSSYSETFPGSWLILYSWQSRVNYIYCSCHFFFCQLRFIIISFYLFLFIKNVSNSFYFSVVYPALPLSKKCLSPPVLKQGAHPKMHVIALCWCEHTILKNNFELLPSPVQFTLSPSHHKWCILHITVDLSKYVIKKGTKNSIKHFSWGFWYYLLSAFHFLSL